MKRIYGITLLSALAAILVSAGLHRMFFDNKGEEKIKVGFVYVGDASTAYTDNFIRVQNAIEKEYGERVEIISKYNISEGKEEPVLQELVERDCSLIFTTSYGYGETAKEFAKKYPEIEFCQATCLNANEEPKLPNYHTFMGSIYQGRYISGVVAGMKLSELIEEGVITKEQAKIGYVGAFPFAEVISGYTAFFLGVRSVVPEAEMIVKYTNTWSSYEVEKRYAEELIEKGCIIISQHSDTVGPAVACEETDRTQIVYHVGYNQTMAEIAPTTYLVGCRINWEPYMLAAVEAVLSGKPIEKCVTGNINGNDVGAGFEKGWVKMLELNEVIAAKGSKEKIEELVNGFEKGQIEVFKGDYIGVNPDNSEDIYDLNVGYKENETTSAPTFAYILKDGITIE